MYRVLGMINMSLLVLVALLGGITLGVACDKAMASTPGHCDNVENPLNCPPGQTFSNAYAGHECGMSSLDGCCLYDAFNIYCNGIYIGTSYVLHGNYSGTCTNHTCTGYNGP